MSASPIESTAMDATGVSVQFGSSGAPSALDAGRADVAELDNSTGPTASELEEVVSPFCAVAELEISVCWMAEELGTVALERGATCSLEELKVAFWFTSGEVELSSPHAVKRDADNSAPVNTKEICECLCIV